jgi:hypothetical protein
MVPVYFRLLTKSYTSDFVVTIWAHECNRSFPDKFISKED